MKRYTFLLTELNPDPDKWARVRDEGNGRVVMTFKHVHDTTRIDATDEIEFTVSSFEDAVQFMEKLGFTTHTFQENDRETWEKDGMEVTMNQWPALPVFAEVEGPTEAAVKAASAELGFDYAQAVFGGVGRVYALQTAYTGEADSTYIGRVPQLTFAREAQIAMGPAANITTLNR
jgi:adenylate cyclase class 2